MASKLKLQPNPTFKCKVDIPVPGCEAVPVEFEFRHRVAADAYKFYGEWLARDEFGGDGDTEMLYALIAGWDIEEDYSRDNLALLLANYPAAGQALVDGYLDGLLNRRRGN